MRFRASEPLEREDKTYSAAAINKIMVNPFPFSRPGWTHHCFPPPLDRWRRHVPPRETSRCSAIFLLAAIFFLANTSRHLGLLGAFLAAVFVLVGTTKVWFQQVQVQQLRLFVVPFHGRLFQELVEGFLACDTVLDSLRTLAAGLDKSKEARKIYPQIKFVACVFVCCECKEFEEQG